MFQKSFFFQESDSNIFIIFVVRMKKYKKKNLLCLVDYVLTMAPEVRKGPQFGSKFIIDEMNKFHDHDHEGC